MHFQDIILIEQELTSVQTTSSGCFSDEFVNQAQFDEASNVPLLWGLVDSRPIRGKCAEREQKRVHISVANKNDKVGISNTSDNITAFEAQA